MTNTLGIAAVFLAASIAATTSLLHEPVTRVHPDIMQGTDTLATDKLATDTRRGTRIPLGADPDSLPAVGDQPRRGQRTDLQLAGNSMSAPSADGLRRGTR